jgi:hypothetical protein
MPTEPDITEFEQLSEVEELRKANEDLQRRLKRAKARSEDLVAATEDGAKAAFVALGPVPPVPKPKARSATAHKPEVALWHLTDWQGGKLTTTYNSDVMRKRLLAYCDTVDEITQIQRADHPVDECVILFGGDLIEGLLIFPGQAFEVDATIFDQYARVSHLVAEVIRRALATYKSVRVVGEWGNHGRVGEKRSQVPRSDNYDRLIYFTVQQMLADEKRLSWELSEEDIQPFQVGNYRATLMHGDEIGRNGHASPATMVQYVVRQKSGAFRVNGKPWPFRDAYVGHRHTHSEWPLPDGEGAVFQTGAPESDNRYAQVSMAAGALPTQRLHFVDPRKGRVTGQFKVWLS